MKAVMLRRIDNPPNPYLSQHREWLGPPPPAGFELYEEHARSILSENDSPDIPFRWSVNPYRGCQHACAYCYARPTHEYLGFGAGTDFESRITAKINAPELLAAELSRRSWQRDLIAFSGVTDCYQPIEVHYQLTRRCLEICLRLGNPFVVVTKSYLVVRDADLLTEAARRRIGRVFFSIPFTDDAVARRIEPGATPPSRRFQALRRLHDAGAAVGVMVAPIIPGLSDREIARVLKRAADCGARVAGYQALRLPGSVKEVFLSRLRDAMPDRAARVEALIRQMRGGRLSDPRFGARMRGSGPYWQAVEQLFRKTAARLGINRRGSDSARRSTNHDASAPVADASRTGAQPSRDSSRPRQLPLFAE
jgi:DNA repair photolyase